jgi:hypothetical protein
VHPYLRSGFEELLGLVDAQDRPKPGVEFFLEFAREVQTALPPLPPADPVGLYFPAHYYLRGEPANPGNDPRVVARALTAANFLLRQLDRKTRIVRGDQPLDPALRTLLVPGAIPDGEEAERLEAWVRAGGRLIWHGVEPMKWGHVYARLLGARPVDYRAPLKARVEAFGEAWSFERHAGGVRVELRPEGAQALARDQHGLPVLLCHELGAGRIVYSPLRIEDEFAAVSGDRAARAPWVKWYAGILALC